MRGMGLVVVGAGLAVLGSLAGGAPPVRAQQLPSVDEVVAHLDDLYRAESSHAIMTMTVVRERGTRELRLESWSRGQDEALIVIRAPAREAGTATLRTEEGLWNYLPRSDRLMRIPTGLLSDDWMGSHFSNDDLMRETSYHQDYESRLGWTTRDGTRYLRVTMTPRPDAPVVYTRVDFLLTPERWTPVLTEFYDEGELVRTMRFDEVRTVAGRELPMRMTLTPARNPDQRTEMRYESLELGARVDPDLFSLRGLRRVAR